MFLDCIAFHQLTLYNCSGDRGDRGSAGGFYSGSFDKGGPGGFYDGSSDNGGAGGPGGPGGPGGLYYGDKDSNNQNGQDASVAAE